MFQILENLPATAQNIAALLQPSVGSPSRRDEVEAAVAAIAMLVTACGGSDVGEKPSDAPARGTVETAPNPPMSSSDIDAIVRDQGGAAAAPPANTGNSSGPLGN